MPAIAPQDSPSPRTSRSPGASSIEARCRSLTRTRLSASASPLRSGGEDPRIHGGGLLDLHPFGGAEPVQGAEHLRRGQAEVRGDQHPVRLRLDQRRATARRPRPVRRRCLPAGRTARRRRVRRRGGPVRRGRARCSTARRRPAGWPRRRPSRRPCPPATGTRLVISRWTPVECSETSAMMAAALYARLRSSSGMSTPSRSRVLAGLMLTVISAGVRAGGGDLFIQRHRQVDAGHRVVAVRAQRPDIQ